MDIKAIGVPNLYACSVRVEGTINGWSTTKIDSPTFYVGAASPMECRKKIDYMYRGLLQTNDTMYVNIGLVE